MTMSRKNRKRLTDEELQAASGGFAAQPKSQDLVRNTVTYGDTAMGERIDLRNTVNTGYREYK